MLRWCDKNGQVSTDASAADEKKLKRMTEVDARPSFHLINIHFRREYQRACVDDFTAQAISRS